jgi:nicotinate phosphoribosyltransferase
MQVFTRKSGVLCGMDEAVAVLKLCSENPDTIKIRALYDGDRISKGETVLTIEGDYSKFAHLETVYLGALARGTSLATAVRETVENAADKPVMFFAARFDHYSVQSVDGYAALIGGAAGVSTDANGFMSGVEGVGTIPHSLIAAFDGNTLSACKAFRNYIDPEVTLIALVDFDNDCIGTSLEVAQYFGKKLWGVRLDTSGDIRDISVTAGGKDTFGVTPELTMKLRKALDTKGFDWVKIVLSGGFNSEKIKRFISLDVPFDAVGVGSSFYKKKIDFTADIVVVNGKPRAKAGRSLKPNLRLEKA